MSNTTVTNANALLFLHAQTPMHPGSGTALGVVDLPVQRERHTQWPVIPGSALKGILRDACREKARAAYENDRRKANEDDPHLTAVFGPGKVDDSNSYAGALSVTDARILAFPVRSLKGVFAWVTSPAVLERLARDAGLAGIESLTWNIGIQENQALCTSDTALAVGDSIVLEEFDFSILKNATASSIAQWISANAVSDAYTNKRILTNLVVLHDDDFGHFVRHATEVAARIGLDYEKKTVKKGALFYEEFLPAETLFYSVLLVGESRSKSQMSADKVRNYLQDNLPSVLQIGADETIGKGLCLTRLLLAEEV